MNSGSAATYSGNITLGADSTIKNAGTLSLTGNINGGFGLTLTTTSTNPV